MEKFNDWEFDSDGIEKRLPYIYEHRLTTSGSPSSNIWGSITGKLMISVEATCDFSRISNQRRIQSIAYVRHKMANSKSLNLIL